MIEAGFHESRRKTMENCLAVLAENGYRFEKLDMKHRDMYLRYEPITELSCRCFVSQYAYAEEDCICCWEDEEDKCLVCIFLNMDNRLSAYPPMFAEYTPERFAAVVKKLRAMFERLNSPVRFEYASETDVQRFECLGCAAEVTAPPKEADYIYKFEALQDFSGGANANRRRRHNHFLNRHKVALERVDRANAAECRMVLDQWCAAHKCEDCGYRCQRNTALRALDKLDDMNAMGYLLRMDGIGQAVVLLGHMSPDMLDVLTTCSINREMGVEETLYAMIAEEVSPPYRYMNLEEDMGVERLRLHKQSLRPDRMQPKYTLILPERLPLDKEC